MGLTDEQWEVLAPLIEACRPAAKVPARHLRRRGEARSHLGKRKAETQGAGRRGERVRDVEVAQERQRHLAAAEASL